jgi:alpha-L-rhamnosidase
MKAQHPAYLVSLMGTDCDVAAGIAGVQMAVDEHGPVVNPGMQIVVDKQGVLPRGYRFENARRKTAPWQARWVWVDDESPRLQILSDDDDYTGDRTIVEEMAPYVHKLLAACASSWSGKNGLFSDAPNDMFMDWVNLGGFTCHHPPAVIGQRYLTALYYRGLELAMRVAELKGGPARSAMYAQRRREIAEAFNCELWNNAKGLYRDGKPFQTSVRANEWLPADKDIEAFSPPANLLAVLYDLAPWERQAMIVDRVMAEKPLNTQPWFMHWVFQAIDRVGQFDRHGLDQMRRWQIISETLSFREMWRGGDLSHGWCSSPLVQMSARVLGVTPTSPGFKTMAIRPLPCCLTWAKGRVPTPQGDVSVSWNLAAGRFLLDPTVPEGAEADVIVAAKTVHVKVGRHHLDSDRPTRTEIRVGTKSGHALLCNRKVDCLNDTGALN